MKMSSPIAKRDRQTFSELNARSLMLRMKEGFNVGKEGQYSTDRSVAPLTGHLYQSRFQAQIRGVQRHCLQKDCSSFCLYQSLEFRSDLDGISKLNE